MESNKNIFIIDIPHCELDQEVVIIGIVTHKKEYQNGYCGINIKDITGNLLCLINLANPKEEDLYKNIYVNSRIRIIGRVIENSKGKRVLSKVKNIEILGTLKSGLSVLDSDMREQASRMLMSRICKKISSLLQSHNYVEFESRLMSKSWYEDSLEPLQVLFPGFGTPAYLISSPAAQVIDFLTTTIVSRAFTVSTSFSYSYRFPNGSSETKAIVAKAINVPEIEQENIILEISSKILSEFNLEVIPSTFIGEWPDMIDGELYFDKILENELNIIKFTANIPVIGKNWNTNIDAIFQVLDKKKNILAEGSREKIGTDLTIYSITIYPSQYLGLIEKPPFRQLQNLTKIYDGKN